VWHQTPAAEPIELAVLGFLVLSVSPLFIRLAWPTRTMPAGPLRLRLEAAARRAGFKFNDLLIWDTGHLMVNACVTGVLPQFRYVLITDALVETLDRAEIAAVFGHELGHVAHRHLPFFGLFFLGSLGLLSILSEQFTFPADWLAGLSWVPAGREALAGEIVEAALVLGSLGILFWLVFGYLSRRFERQADVFGCKVVSCSAAECPPHFDLEEADCPAPSEDIRTSTPCPVGIRIFADALAKVAGENGIDPSARSWRHGSIASRLRFLQRLAADLDQERRFQLGVRRLRLLLAAVLVLALLAAWWVRF
jgi:STE24 endopeptidase